MVKWLRQSKLISAATTGERQEKYTMENFTLTSDLNLDNVVALSDRLAKLDKSADQKQLAEAIGNATLVQIAAVSNHGERIAGSAERAVAAWLNAAMPVTLGDQWYAVEYRDKSDIAKTLAPHKKDIFTAWNSSNPSTKWARVRAYGEELAEPTIRELIEAEQIEEVREYYYDQFGLLSPEDQANGVQIADEETQNSRTRDLYERSVVEIGKLYRALTASDNDAIIKAHAKRAQITAALEHLTKALTALDAPTEDEDLAKFMKEVAKR
jgi:hypothetical protein